MRDRADAKAPSPGPHASPPSSGPLPSAWQPLTWRGVAAFSRARIGRLLLVQTLVLLLVVGAVLWFLNTAWFPIIREAIRQLPESGQMQHQQLASPRTSVQPLVETRLLAFVIDVDDVGAPHRASDLQVEFHRRRIVICSFLGCRSVSYLAGWTMPLNRPELESQWEAWEPMIYLMTGGALAVGFFFSWSLLATLYCPFVRLYAFFKDRELTLLGSWKLAAAALLPGSLLVSGSIILYGLGTIGLIRFCCLWLLHFALGWVYLVASPSRLPSVSAALPAALQNPFGDGDAKTKPDHNPFVPSKP